MEQEEIEIKDLDLDEFDRFLLALVKFYPEGKKQKQLAEEAGIDPSLISKWKKGERGRAEEKEYYKKFFTEYIDTKEYVISKTLKLKIVPDLFDKLIEIARKDNRAKEIIGKSEYFKQLISTNLEFLITALTEGIIDDLEAKDVFLGMLEASGVTKDKIIKKMNISEKALSCYIEILLGELARSALLLRGKLILLPYTISKKLEDVIYNKNIVIRSILSAFIELNALLGVTTLTVSDELPPIGSKEEVREFLKWLAKNVDESILRSLDIFRQDLLSWRGDKWVIDRWINLGCAFIKLRFRLKWEDLVELLRNGKYNVEIEVENSFRLGGKTCLLDGKECNVKNILNCEKIKKFYEAGDFESYLEVIEK